MTGCNNWTKKKMRFVTLRQHALNNLALKRELQTFQLRNLPPLPILAEDFRRCWKAMCSCSCCLYWILLVFWINESKETCAQAHQLPSLCMLPSVVRVPVCCRLLAHSSVSEGSARFIAFGLRARDARLRAPSPFDRCSVAIRTRRAGMWWTGLCDQFSTTPVRNSAFLLQTASFPTLETSAASMHWWPCQCKYKCTSTRKYKHKRKYKYKQQNTKTYTNQHIPLGRGSTDGSAEYLLPHKTGWGDDHVPWCYARCWVGGWGDDHVPWTCQLGWCYARRWGGVWWWSRSLNLPTWLILCKMLGGGVGWWSRSLNLPTWLMLRKMLAGWVGWWSRSLNLPTWLMLRKMLAGWVGWWSRSLNLPTWLMLRKMLAGWVGWWSRSGTRAIVFLLLY